MLSKKTYPMLNRVNRRHPAEVVSLADGWQAGGNWLLAGLLARGGYNYRAPQPIGRDDPNYGAQV